MPRRPAPISAADVYDRLRRRVEADPRSVAQIAAGLAPPMSASQLGQILRGERDPTLRTLARITAGLEPPCTLAELIPRD